MSQVDYSCSVCKEQMTKGDSVVGQHAISKKYSIKGVVVETWQESDALSFLQKEGSVRYDKLNKLLIRYLQGQEISGVGWWDSCDLIHSNCSAANN